jgi:hypothetical protein
MIRPCVARGVRRGGECGRASMSPASGMERLLLPAIMDCSAHPISKTERPRGRFGSPVFEGRREDRPPSLFILSQTSAGELGPSPTFGHFPLSAINAARKPSPTAVRPAADPIHRPQRIPVRRQRQGRAGIGWLQYLIDGAVAAGPICATVFQFGVGSRCACPKGHN